MTAISVQNIVKTFPDGTTALNDVSFSIRKGEWVVLLGHNGSGKSTLFNCIAGFEKPTHGTILVNEGDITAYSKKKIRSIRKKVGIVFQDFHLVYNLSVFQNVLFGALGQSKTVFSALAPFASSALRAKAMDSLDRVGLAHLATRRADQLSGGQQQRVAIARTLMQDPDIILADEPIASLDPRAGMEIMDLLAEIVAERNITVLCILHQMDIAKTYGDRIIGLHSGTVILDKPRLEVEDHVLSTLYDKQKPSEVVE